MCTLYIQVFTVYTVEFTPQQSVETSAVIRDLEFRMRSDVIVGYRRQTNVDPCAQKGPYRNLLLLHLFISLCTLVHGML